MCACVHACARADLDIFIIAAIATNSIKTVDVLRLLYLLLNFFVLLSAFTPVLAFLLNGVFLLLLVLLNPSIDQLLHQENQGGEFNAIQRSFRTVATSSKGARSCLNAGDATCSTGPLHAMRMYARLVIIVRRSGTST